MKTVKITFSPDHAGERSPYSKGMIRDKVAEVMNRRGIDGYTLLSGLRYWKGVAERSYTIEVAGIEDAHILEDLTSVARDLKEAFDQESVLLRVSDENFNFI